MPILPIIDLLLLMGWTSLFAAVAVKAIHVATTYRPLIFGLGPLDLVIVATVLLIFALALAARTWVKAFEAGILQSSRRTSVALDQIPHPDAPEEYAPSAVVFNDPQDDEPVEPRPAASG